VVWWSRATRAWVALLAAVAGGAGVGVAVKVAEWLGLPGASDFGNYFGLWILLAALVAVWSPGWQWAVLHVVLFLLAMVTSYYLSTLWLYGYLLRHLLVAWSVVALVLAPPFAAIVWHARREGWVAALAVALPVGLLLYEAFSLRWVLHIHATQFVFNILAAGVLLLVLPRGSQQQLRVLAISGAIFVGVRVVIEIVVEVVMLRLV
jgi:hypothetical protein